MTKPINTLEQSIEAIRAERKAMVDEIDEMRRESNQWSCKASNAETALKKFDEKVDGILVKGKR